MTFVTSPSQIRIKLREMGMQTSHMGAFFTSSFYGLPSRISCLIKNPKPSTAWWSTPRLEESNMKKVTSKNLPPQNYLRAIKHSNWNPQKKDLLLWEHQLNMVDFSLPNLISRGYTKCMTTLFGCDWMIYLELFLNSYINIVKPC